MTRTQLNLDAAPSCRTVARVCFWIALACGLITVRSLHGGVWHFLVVIAGLGLVRVTSRCEEL